MRQRCTKPLIIDPVLTYSTYLGGSGTDMASDIAVDAAGNAYVTGSTNATNFPTVNPLQTYGGGPFDAFIAKLNADCTALIYSTYLGGSGIDQGHGIALDTAGNAYVSGVTSSTNFPTRNPLQPVVGGGPNDRFVAKLDAAGSVVYSTYLGGSGPDGGTQAVLAFKTGIAVDASGNVYLADVTASSDFPTTPGAFQRNFGGAQDAFVAKLNAAGSALTYSTYLGGSGNDAGTDIAVDASGNAYVAGQTNSPNFPVVDPLQPAVSGGPDVFVSKLNASGSALIYSTYLGGSGNIEMTFGLAVDAGGNAYVTGATNSTNFPTANALQPTFGGGDSDAFLVKLNAAGSAFVYSTYLGGSGSDNTLDMVVDSSGNAYLTGFVGSTNFPTANPLQSAFGGGRGDAFVAKLNAAGSGLIYSTYLGGSGPQVGATALADAGQAIAVDAAGNAYVVGRTNSVDFPLANPLQPAFGGDPQDAFVAKISEMTGPYTITDRGGVSFPRHGASALNVGYARVDPSPGSTTPSGMAILGFRQNNVLISETGVPAPTLVTSGRIFADVGGQVNTGIAIANGNNQAVSVSFFFTDEAGQNSAQGSITIPANGQIARFLNEVPFNAGPSFRGTMTFNVSAPIGVIALRGFTNERSEFLITNLPIVDLSTAASETAVIPHFADGGGWTTTIVLLNSTDGPESGSIQFLGHGSANVAAEPVSVTIGNQQSSTFSYTVPPRASVRFQSGGSTATVRTGSVRVSPALFNRIPSAFAISSFRNAGVTVSEVGVQAARPGSAFRMYAEASGNFGQSAIGSIQTGIAIASTSSVSGPVSFELTSLTGALTGLNGSVTVPPQGQVAIFLNQIPGFQSLPLPFQGMLRISTTLSSGVSIMGIRGRYNERGDFLMATIPPVSEAGPASSAATIFPHWTIGGGYSTQFILFGIPGETSTGVLRFFSQTGQTLN